MAVVEAAGPARRPRRRRWRSRPWVRARRSRGTWPARWRPSTKVWILRQRNLGLSPWPTIHHLLAMGRVTAMAGDLSRAEQLLDQAAEQMSRFTDGMDAMHARLGAARATLRRLRLDDPGLESLTPREVDVLRLLPSRLSLGEIAGELYLTRNTVKTSRPSPLPKARSNLALRGGAARTPTVPDLICDRRATSHPGEISRGVRRSHPAVRRNSAVKQQLRGPESR